MKNKYIYNQGFTLIETITSVVLMSVLTFLIVSVFHNIQLDYAKEKSKTLIHDYCNSSLNQIASYVENASDGVSTTGANAVFPIYKLEMISKDDEGVPITINGDYVFEKIDIKCDDQRGIQVNGSPLPGFYKNDPNSPNTFKITKFKIEKVDTPNNIALPPSIISSMYESSYDITIEVDATYIKLGKSYEESLTYKRKVFTPNTFLGGNSNV